MTGVVDADHTCIAPSRKFDVTELNNMAQLDKALQPCAAESIP
jgi:hypothetical protein